MPFAGSRRVSNMRCGAVLSSINSTSRPGMCPMPSESQVWNAALRRRVHMRIEDGRLPVMLSERSVATYGEGNRCVACDQPITPGQVECEVDLQVNGSHCRLRLHLTCYDIWQLECHKRIRGSATQQVR